MARCDTTDGFAITIDASCLIGRHLYLTGELDRSIVEIWTAFALPGDTLLDIGANIGYASACLLSRVSHSSVIDVEPQHRLRPILRRNLPDRQIYPFVVSKAETEGWLFALDGNLGTAWRLS